MGDDDRIKVWRKRSEEMHDVTLDDIVDGASRKICRTTDDMSKVLINIGVSNALTVASLS